MAKKEAKLIIKARDEASKKFKKIGQSGIGMGSMLKKAAAMGAAYFGGRAMIGGLKESIELFGTQEMAVNHLQSALDNLNMGQQSKEMQDFASSIQAVTTEGDEATLELMALGASMGGMAGDQLKAATQAAIGFSRSLGIDTKAAMTLVAKAAQGNTTSFSRYGVQLDATMSKEEQFQLILRKGAEGFKMAQAETETTSGKMTQLSNAWGDFKETIGGAITGVFPSLFGAMSKLSFAIENFGETSRMAANVTILGFVTLYEDIKYGLTVKIPAYLSWFADNWKNIFTNIWEGTKSVFSNMYKNVSSFFKAVWAWFKGEGFDFKWTGLLDGFESTMAELPNIAKRNMTGLESELLSGIAIAQVKLSKKWDDKKSMQFDTEAVINAAAKASGPAVVAGVSGTASALSGGASQQPLDASQNRFFGLGTGKTVEDKIADNTKKTNDIQQKSLDTLKTIATSLKTTASNALVPQTNLGGE